jgi:hypothetical protein
MRRENDQMDYFFSFSETRFAVHISLTFLISVIDIDCEFTLTFLLGLVVCLTKYFAYMSEEFLGGNKSKNRI